MDGLHVSAFWFSSQNANTIDWKNTRDLVKKIRDNKGIFHGNMGSIKDRNGMDLTEAEGIKKS